MCQLGTAPPSPAQVWRFSWCSPLEAHFPTLPAGRGEPLSTHQSDCLRPTPPIDGVQNRASSLYNYRESGPWIRLLAGFVNHPPQEVPFDRMVGRDFSIPKQVRPGTPGLRARADAAGPAPTVRRPWRTVRNPPTARHHPPARTAAAHGSGSGSAAPPRCACGSRPRCGRSRR